jgi:alpha-beta hydrolase superfamily lysophospholipase
MKHRNSKQYRKIIWFALLPFLALNTIAYNHAYQFTHFTDPAAGGKINAYSLTGPEKLKALFMGVANPRPENKKLPAQPYEHIRLKGIRMLSCWLIPVPDPKGTVILFHGYGGEKSSLLDKAAEFGQLGYHTFLVDFMGSGGSAGNQTTIGYHEAEQVKTALAYIRQRMGGKVFLFGNSMGAVAILKALQDYPLQPAGVLLECPFGSMYETTCARFRLLNIPAFPFAGLLVFWGGIQNDFWAFSHNPATYAKAVACPVLLLYGEQDPKVSRAEIEEIYANLRGPKQLKTYPEAGHENYLLTYKQEWVQDVAAFLGQYSE